MNEERIVPGTIQLYVEDCDTYIPIESFSMGTLGGGGGGDYTFRNEASNDIFRNEAGNFVFRNEVGGSGYRNEARTPTRWLHDWKNCRYIKVNELDWEFVEGSHIDIEVNSDELLDLIQNGG